MSVHCRLRWTGQPRGAVRESVGTAGLTAEEVILADAELNGGLAPGVLHVVVGRTGLVFLFALGEQATWRILATRPRRDSAGAGEYGQPGPEVPASDIQQIIDATGLEVSIRELRWSSRVRLQHRLAAAFRHGPLFLAGDAAHTHSPAAAQGMNTGILDAVNLGWKLAFAGGNGKHTTLLNSYERERRPVAWQVIALTHMVFFAKASTNVVPAIVRGTLVPLLAPVLPLLLKQQLPTAQVLRLLSHGWVRYRHSALSMQGGPGGHGPHPGDRLPDQDVRCDGQAVRLHELTARPGVHVLLERDTRMNEDLRGSRVTLHRISSWPGQGLVAVRPDGYVGFRSGDSDPARLAAWLDLVGAR